MYFFIGERIIALRKSANRPSFSYANSNAYISATFYLIKSDRINLKYLTGLLNSNLVLYWLQNKGKMQGNNYQIDKEPILEIPILNSSNVQAQDQIVQCVDQLLQLNKELYIATLETKREQIKQKIDYNEDKINALVYELYELTAEEINLIENS
jgi:adenine-specific DNA-methyltransferase